MTDAPPAADNLKRNVGLFGVVIREHPAQQALVQLPRDVGDAQAAFHATKMTPDATMESKCTHPNATRPSWIVRSVTDASR